MEERTKRSNASPFGWISFILSVFFWLLIFKFLFYWMDIRSVIRFSTFEAISLPVSVIPLISGVLGCVRKESHLVLSIIGIIIASLTFIWLLVMMALNGM